MLDHEAKISVLNRTLHHTVNSVLQYVEVSTPYIPAGFEDRYEAVKLLRDEEIASANKLVDMINGLDGVPSVGVFPYWNVDLNYLDFRFMAEFAAQHIAKAIAVLERDLATVGRDAELVALLGDVLKQRRVHHDALLVASGAADEIAAEAAAEAAQKSTDEAKTADAAE